MVLGIIVSLDSLKCTPTNSDIDLYATRSKVFKHVMHLYLKSINMTWNVKHKC